MMVVLLASLCVSSNPSVCGWDLMLHKGPWSPSSLRVLLFFPRILGRYQKAVCLSLASSVCLRDPALVPRGLRAGCR